MKNIKHRKSTISSLTSLACFNVIRSGQQREPSAEDPPPPPAAISRSPECCSAETFPGKRRKRLLWSPSSSWAASQRGHCNGKHVPHPGLTDHTIHAGTSGMAKPCERRLLEAAGLTSATDPAALMRKQWSCNSTPLQISIWSQQSM